MHANNCIDMNTFFFIKLWSNPVFWDVSLFLLNVNTFSYLLNFWNAIIVLLPWLILSTCQVGWKELDCVCQLLLVAASDWKVCCRREGKAVQLWNANAFSRCLPGCLGCWPPWHIAQFPNIICSASDLDFWFFECCAWCWTNFSLFCLGCQSLTLDGHANSSFLPQSRCSNF